MIKKIILFVAITALLILFLYSENLKEIAAGVAILLFGMLFLEDGFKAFSGGPLQRLLKKTTDTLSKSLTFGIISTSLLQSSSLVSVITISFMSAGLIELTSGIGIIFGANLGTTTGAWLISVFGLKVKISSFALPLIVFGVIFILQSNKKLKGVGYCLAGIGFLFLGIHYMKEGFEAFQGSIDLKEYSIGGFWGLIIYTFIGIAATVIMQSSHATLAIILTALSTGQINYVDALSLAIGANIGTTITALVGAMSSNISGKRLAGAHLIFNLVTGIVAIVLINQFKWIVDILADSFGIAQTDYTLKLSIFHTIFNLVGVFIMIPFIHRLEILLLRVYKEKKADISQPRYLTDAAITYPDSAIPALLKETRHLFENSFEIISHGINLHRRDIISEEKLKAIVPFSVKDLEIDIDEIYFRKIKILYSKIVEFATSVQANNLSEENIKLIHHIKVANRYIVEIIKGIKILQPNITKFMVSENPYIRDEYHILRRRIAKVIREIYKAQSAEDIEFQHEQLLIQKRKANLHDVLVNGTLDRLIRERLITTEMATSLMNDSSLIATICEKMIIISELLYFHTDNIVFHERITVTETPNVA
ncbi:MAG: Na/Pi symporter [Bacteroidetes bacterium]|nr:Na/Pi symporter [Bacteroidota bacterium]MBU1677958.1 Na/Pi symporter [Bacteroidota bacterium]MBU2506975.1 Na/Pi symporter [Bacteroidota bacterium]